MAFIEIYLPSGQIEHFDLTKNQMIIGRSPKADITIQHEIISRQHAKISKTSHSRWIIEDMDSRNKTYFNKRAIKSHLLNNEDEIRLGSIKIVFHDPSGKSDEKIEQTVYLKKDSPLKLPDENICPACKAPMQEGAVICIKCGFDKKLGKRRKIVFESTMDATAITDDIAPTNINLTPTVSHKKADVVSENSDKSGNPKALTKLTSEQKQQIIDYVMPISFLLLATIIAFIKGSIINVVLNLISVTLQAIFMLIAMAIAAKIGEFGFGELKTAILKVVGICAALVVIDLLIPYMSFIVGLIVLLGLLKVAFDLDFFELFLIIGVMAILKLFVLMMILNAIMSFMR